MVVEGGHSKKIQSLEPTVLSAEPKCMKLNNRACGSPISEASIRILFSAALVGTRQGGHGDSFFQPFRIYRFDDTFLMNPRKALRREKRKKTYGD